MCSAAGKVISGVICLSAMLATEAVFNVFWEKINILCMHHCGHPVSAAVGLAAIVYPQRKIWLSMLPK
jgi:adenosylmethionine-8-amino-7-oxononanoate aminotransferase